MNMQRLFLILAAVLGSTYACTSPREAGMKCSSANPSLKFYFDKNTGKFSAKRISRLRTHRLKINLSPSHRFVAGVCQPFYYRGCGGNDNRFDSKIECQSKCIKSKGKAHESTKILNAIVDVCGLSTDAKISNAAKQCSSNNECDKKWSCSGGFCCPSKEYVCNLPANQGTQLDGQVSKKQKYAWLRGVNNCLPFSYFGIDGNFNNFPTYDACVAHCKP